MTYRLAARLELDWRWWQQFANAVVPPDGYRWASNPQLQLEDTALVRRAPFWPWLEVK